MTELHILLAVWTTAAISPEAGFLIFCCIAAALLVAAIGIACKMNRD